MAGMIVQGAGCTVTARNSCMDHNLLVLPRLFRAGDLPARRGDGSETPPRIDLSSLVGIVRLSGFLSVVVAAASSYGIVKLSKDFVRLCPSVSGVGFPDGTEVKNCLKEFTCAKVSLSARPKEIR